MSDSEEEFYHTINDYEVCNKCGFYTDSYDHYYQCEVDHAAIAAAKKWVRYMELQDEAIDEYIRRHDDSYLVPSSFIEKYIQDRLK